MGVWIETIEYCKAIAKISVTPFVGVWIETFKNHFLKRPIYVTPFVGVWIETSLTDAYRVFDASHTLRGCVD